MSGRGRPAALPQQGHHRPPVLEPDGFVVTHIDEKGIGKRRYDFNELPCAPELRLQFARQFAQRCGPQGSWRSTKSSFEVWRILRVFATFLQASEPAVERIADISAGVWAAWRLGQPANTLGKSQLRKSAQFLRDHPDLSPETRALTLKRVPRAKPTETSYAPDEFDEIKRTAARVFRAALLRIRENVEHLERWRAGQYTQGTAEWLVGEALEELSRTGHPPRYTSVDGRERVINRYATALGGINAQHTWRRLFLNGFEAAALAVLLVSTYGWNLTPVIDLPVPRATPDPGLDGRMIHRVELEKRRRNQPFRYETVNLADWGADSPGRLISQAIEATAPARATLSALGTPVDRLLVWQVNSRRGSQETLFRYGAALDDALRNLRESFCDTVRLNTRRLRKTTVITERRAPTQHTRDTHDQTYLLPDPRTRERAAGVIGAGITDAMDAAQTAFQAQLTRNASIAAANDTATAGCRDYLNNPHQEPGLPCRASFLMCLACRNAVVAPRHLPRLAYLFLSLEALQAVVPEAVWAQDWDEHHARLLALRQDPTFTATEWADAADAVTPADRETIDLLLRKGFDV